MLVLGELDNQDGVLAGQADQHHEADLREDVDVAVRYGHAGERAEDAHRHHQNDSQGQRPALILGGQYQEHEHHRQREDQVVPDVLGGVDLHVVDLGPLERHARRQDGGAQRLHLLDALAGGHAGFGGAENGGGVVHVVAADVDRPADRLDAKDRTQGHHLAARVAHLEQLDLFGIAAEGAAGLADHLPGAAEAVEVVDVEGAEIDLQGVEDLVRIDAHGLALVAVEVHKQLRRVGAEHTEQLAHDLAVLRTLQHPPLQLAPFDFVTNTRLNEGLGDGVLEEFPGQNS